MMMMMMKNAIEEEWNKILEEFIFKASTSFHRCIDTIPEKMVVLWSKFKVLSLFLFYFIFIKIKFVLKSSRSLLCCNIPNFGSALCIYFPLLYFLILWFFFPYK